MGQCGRFCTRYNHIKEETKWLKKQKKKKCKQLLKKADAAKAYSVGCTVALAKETNIKFDATAEGSFKE